MRHKFSQIMWLLPLVLLLSTTDLGADAVKYNQQVIAVLEDNPAIQKAAHYLYQKHDTTSYVVMWNKNSRMFEQVQWNEQTQSHETLPVQEPLPINQNQWRRTRVQVVGHGDITQRTTTIAGFTAENLAETITTGLSMGDVGRISIVGCTRQAEVGARPHTQAPHYLNSFMNKLKQLGRSRTEVSLRSALVSVDSSGRKLTGELVLAGTFNTPEVGIKWSHKNPSSKWIGKFTRNFYEIQQSPVTASQTGDIESHFFGILPANSDLYVSTSNQGAAAASTTYRMSDANAFEWIDRPPPSPHFPFSTCSPCSIWT